MLKCRNLETKGASLSPLSHSFRTKLPYPNIANSFFPSALVVVVAVAAIWNQKRID